METRSRPQHPSAIETRSVADRLNRRLRRVTTSNRFIPEIDGLRFVAIAAVVIFHVQNQLVQHPVAQYPTSPDNDWAAWIAWQGRYGVHLFFIISGFVLALPFARSYLFDSQRVNLGRYFLRRLTRLEPPYLIVLSACLVALVLLKPERLSELLPHFAAGAIYLHSPIYGTMNPVNAVTWSLEIEVQFYLLVPLLTTVFMIRNKLQRRALILLAMGLAMVGQTIFLADGGKLALSLLNYLQFFLAGFLLADLYLNEMNGAPRKRRAWDVISLVGWPLLVLICSADAVARIAFAPLALLLYCATFCGPMTNRVLTNRWITVVGGMCYTIYLIHLQILDALERFAGSIAVTNSFAVNLLVHIVLALPVLLAASVIVFLLVEKPCMRPDWPHRMLASLGTMLERKPKAVMAGD